MALFLSLFFLAPAFSENEDAIIVEAGTPISDLLARARKDTGKVLLWDAKAPHIRGRTIPSEVKHIVAEAGRFEAYRTILMAYDLRLVSIGPSGFEVYTVVGLRGGATYARSFARWVDYRALLNRTGGEGDRVACVVPVRDASSLVTLRTALSSMSSQQGIGRVMQLRHSILLIDFEPVVRAMVRVVLEAEKLGEKNQTETELIRLEHGDPRAVVDVLLRLYAKAPGPARKGYVPYAPKPVRAAAYAPLRAVVVSATRAELAKVRETIRMLDAPIANKATR